MMSLAVDIVKQRKRKPERFDRAKLQRSIHAACLSVRSHEGVADQTANQVCDAVLIWLEERPKVTSQDIRRVTGKHLKIFHPEAAYMYEQQKKIM